ncbi:hypothetical protein B0H19DRAFT_1056783 [Mycena capillaripes]|nr:hypothetical protein B0H19DRAFT_1056783 [Mycena capillaripes]
MNTAPLSSAKYLLLRLPDAPVELPAFISEEVGRANEKYAIITPEEETNLCELYLEYVMPYVAQARSRHHFNSKVAAGEDAAEVQTAITKHIRNMHDMYFKVQNIMNRAKEAGVDLHFETAFEDIEDPADQNVEQLARIEEIPDIDERLKHLKPLEFVVVEQHD